jgi:hypothetical protein
MKNLNFSFKEVVVLVICGLLLFVVLFAAGKKDPKMTICDQLCEEFGGCVAEERQEGKNFAFTEVVEIKCKNNNKFIIIKE